MDAILPIIIFSSAMGAIVVVLIVVLLRNHYRTIIRDKNSGIMQLLREQERLTQELEYQINKSKNKPLTN